MSVRPSGREGWVRVSSFAAGAVAAIVAADLLSMALLDGGRIPALMSGQVLHHAKFLLTLAGLVIVGGAMGFALAKRALAPRVCAILGAIAAILGFVAGVVSVGWLGVTGSILVIVAMATLVVALAGRIGAHG